MVASDARRHENHLLLWGVEGDDAQYDEPVWAPLIRVVGDRLVGTFMWMHANRSVV
jgi:hypothetical protein